MATRTAAITTLFFTLLGLAIATGGCSSEMAAEEQQSSSSNAVSESTCNDYPRNPACDAKLFVVRAWELANEDPRENLAEPISNAKDCISGLVRAGAIATGSGPAAPIVLSTAVAKEIIETFFACQGFAEYLGRIGVADNISCWLFPQVHDPEVQLCQCREKCQAGVSHSGGFDGEYLRQVTKFRYGFLDRAGSANCYCTNDAKEARCQWRCSQWRSSAPDDCTCAD